MKKIISLMVFTTIALMTHSLASFAQERGGVQSIELQPGSGAMVTVYQPTYVSCSGHSNGGSGGLTKVCSCVGDGYGNTDAILIIYNSSGAESSRARLGKFGAQYECLKLVETSAQCK